MNLHPKIANFDGRLRYVNGVQMTPIFFLVVVLILEIANLDVAAGSEDFCPPKHALMYISPHYIIGCKMYKYW